MVVPILERIFFQQESVIMHQQLLQAPMEVDVRIILIVVPGISVIMDSVIEKRSFKNHT
tara:strand:+ start:187 stop:363 length:177 start_codon:yes stop_codon:yes gene_type:complete